MNTILCVKHGTKYDATYVNNLYNMVERHCSLPFQFICLTDNATGIQDKIKIKDLPAGLQGWWCKPYIFAEELNLTSPVLYIDLDVVIANSIDKLFTYYPNNWCTIRDFTRAQRPDWQKYNSSVIRYNPKELYYVWAHFRRQAKEMQRMFYGDQDYLYHITKEKPAKLFPDEWIKSWKWEIRKDKTLAPGGRGNRKLKFVEDVTPSEECCICVFHGDPNPHNCDDPWVVDNWQ